MMSWHLSNQCFSSPSCTSTLVLPCTLVGPPDLTPLCWQRNFLTCRSRKALYLLRIFVFGIKAKLPTMTMEATEELLFSFIPCPSLISISVTTISKHLQSQKRSLLLRCAFAHAVPLDWNSKSWFSHGATCASPIGPFLVSLHHQPCLDTSAPSAWILCALPHPFLQCPARPHHVNCLLVCLPY